jgi:hypothetical protein
MLIFTRCVNFKQMWLLLIAAMINTVCRQETFITRFMGFTVKIFWDRHGFIFSFCLMRYRHIYRMSSPQMLSLDFEKSIVTQILYDFVVKSTHPPLRVEFWWHPLPDDVAINRRSSAPGRLSPEFHSLGWRSDWDHVTITTLYELPALFVLMLVTIMTEGLKIDI